MSATVSPSVSVRGLSVAFGSREALSDVSFRLFAGSFVGVLGPNGAGKTTLLRALLGTIGYRGSVRLQGRPAYVPQGGAIDANFPIDALGVVLAVMPRLTATTFDGAWAGAAGVSERRVSSLVLVLVSLVVVCALPAVGSLLVSALLVVPAATARLIVTRLGPMLTWTTGLCVLETIAGLLAARSLDVPPGAAIAVAAGLAFGLVAAVVAASRHTRVAPA